MELENSNFYGYASRNYALFGVLAGHRELDGAGVALERHRREHNQSGGQNPTVARGGGSR